MSLDPKLTDATVSALRQLRLDCLRSETVFRSSAGQSRAEDVRALLRRRAEDSKAAADVLQAHVQRLDKRISQQGSQDDLAAPAWNLVRSTLASHTDLALLQECERQEDTVLERYAQALSRALEPAARQVIEMQRLEMRQQHELLRTLRDRVRGLGA